MQQTNILALINVILLLQFATWFGHKLVRYSNFSAQFVCPVGRALISCSYILAIKQLEGTGERIFRYLLVGEIMSLGKVEAQMLTP